MFMLICSDSWLVTLGSLTPNRNQSQMFALYFIQESFLAANVSSLFIYPTQSHMLLYYSTQSQIFIILTQTFLLCSYILLNHKCFFFILISYPVTNICYSYTNIFSVYKYLTQLQYIHFC